VLFSVTARERLQMVKNCPDWQHQRLLQRTSGVANWYCGNDGRLQEEVGAWAAN
jgi:hypothetical protein